MSKRIKTAISIIAFLCVLAGTYYVVDRTLRFKYEDGILPMEDLYEYPRDSIDVLFLGSSHVGVNVDTVRLCSNYGIASYNLWGAVQPTWNSYYNLLEALKTQTPRVVVLETFLVSQDYEYMDYSRIIKNTMGMRLSLNKVRAVMASAEGSLKKDVLLGFSTYHTRYGSLEEEDFTRYAWNRQISDKNIHNGDYVTVCTEPAQAAGTEPLSDKMETYFIKIIELCRDKDIPLLLYTSPYSVSEKEQMRYNTVAQIARDYGVPYINYNLSYKEIGIDYSADYADSAGHLNNGGVAKMTDAIGAYLKENYELPERFGDRWFNRWPDTDAVYVLHEPFAGDGTSAFLDTGVKLYYDDQKSYTVMMQFQPHIEGGEGVYLSCFSEEEPYRGLLVREGNGLLQIIIGDNYYTEHAIPEGVTATLAVTKSGTSYDIYLNGECVVQDVNSVCGQYRGNLLIGCQDSPGFRKQKFSNAKVDKLEVYDEVLADDTIYEWMSDNATRITREQKAELLKESYTGSLAYVMPQPFAGDGQSAYLDTGVQLFYEPKRDWTLLVDYDTDITSADGVIAGCFAEEEGAFRGILLRRDEQALHVIVGASHYVEILPDEDASAKLAVTKKGDTYSVYVNGIPVAENIESPCASYIGTLLVGAQLSGELEPFRYTAVTVNRLEVREGIMTPAQIQQW